MNCEFERVGRRWSCVVCGWSTPAITERAPVSPCPRPGHVPSSPGAASPVVLIRNDVEGRGPCLHRGELVAIERCRIGCQREKQVETFLCLPDAGCHGPAPIVSEEQFAHEQTLNRRRLVCGWCVRYQPRPG